MNRKLLLCLLGFLIVLASPGCRTFTPWQPRYNPPGPSDPPAPTLAQQSPRPKKPTPAQVPDSARFSINRNFLVKAPTAEIADYVGEWLEVHRWNLARKWLGKPLAAWTEPITVDVEVTRDEANGWTRYAFENGRLSGHIHLAGQLERIAHSGAPHEVAHLMLATHFGGRVPLWANEGGAVESEDESSARWHQEQARLMVKTPGRAVPLSRLLTLTQYPEPDAMPLYIEGYSLTRYLIDLRDRKTFLAFVGDGRQGDWDSAVKKHYGYGSVAELERAWLRHLDVTTPTHLPEPSSPSSWNRPRFVK